MSMIGQPGVGPAGEKQMPTRGYAYTPTGMYCTCPSRVRYEVEAAAFSGTNDAGMQLADWAQTDNGFCHLR
jgi:hypothetical protein